MFETGSTRAPPKRGLASYLMAVGEQKGKGPALQDGFGPAWVQAVPEEEAAVPARCAMFILPMMMVVPCSFCR